MIECLCHRCGAEWDMDADPSACECLGDGIHSLRVDGSPWGPPVDPDGRQVTVIDAAKAKFTVELPEITVNGKPRTKTYHYAWGACTECGERQLTQRAGIGQKKCRMTPRCPGKLARIDDFQTFPVKET